MKKQTLITLCILNLGILTAKGQEVFAPAGNSAENNNISLDWTIGETIISTDETTDNNLTQGFHQGNIIITAINQIDDLPFEISAYPNPANDYINIKTDYKKVDNLTYTLYNLNGKIIEQKKMKNNEISVLMTKHPSGIYLLKITENNINLKTFKIVKK